MLRGKAVVLGDHHYDRADGVECYWKSGRIIGTADGCKYIHSSCFTENSIAFARNEQRIVSRKRLCRGSQNIALAVGGARFVSEMSVSLVVYERGLM